MSNVGSSVFFAQATFVHVQKVSKIFLHRKFFCTFKKGVFWHVKPLKISVWNVLKHVKNTYLGLKILKMLYFVCIAQTFSDFEHSER